MTFFSLRDRAVLADIRALFSVNVRPFCWLFLLYSIGIFAVLRSNVLYVNDTSRVLARGLYLKNVGRVLSDWLGSVFFIPAADLSPLTQLGAVACMAGAAVFVCATLYRRRMTLWQVLCCVPLGLSPYFLQYLSYKFDSLFMGMSALCVTGAFYCLTHHGRSRMGQVVSCLALFSVMCLYQAMINLFFTLGIFWCAGRMLEGVAWRKIVLSALRVLPALAVALLAYRGAMHFVELNSYMLKHNDVMPLGELGQGLLKNIGLYVQYLREDWGDNRMGAAAAAVLALFTLCQMLAAGRLPMPAGQRLLRFLGGHALLWLGAVALPGLMLLLPDMVLEPRVFAPVGFYLSLSTLFIQQHARSLQRGLGVLVCGTLVVYCFGFAAAYGNALTMQDDFERMIYSQLIMDMSKYCEQYKTNKVRFAGYMPRSPQLKALEEDFPAVLKLVPVTLRNGDWHTPRKLTAWGVPVESEQDTRNMKTEPLLHTAFYDIAVNSDNVLFLTFPFGRQDGKGR